MKNCSNCGKQIDGNFEFCPYCGAKVENQKKCAVCGTVLNDDYLFCPVCGSSVSGEKICPSCGKKAEGEFGFCPHCGTAYANNFTAGVKAETTKERQVKRVRKSDKTSLLTKFKAQRKNIEKIAFTVIMAVILVCSFFGTVSMDMTDTVESVSSGVKVDGEIKAQISAVEIIGFSFFAIGVDKDSAQDYLDNIDESMQEKILEVVSDPKYIQTNGLSVILTKEGCREVSNIVSSTDMLKTTYATAIVADEESAARSMLVWKIAGFLLLAFILFCATLFVISLISIFNKKQLPIIALTVAVVAFAAIIAVMLASSSIDMVMMQVGAAYVAIFVFAAILLAYYMVAGFVFEKKTDWRGIASGAVSLASGIILVSMFFVPSIQVKLPYESEKGDKTVFKYEFSQFEGFEEFYFPVNEESRMESSEINQMFETDAERFTSDSYINSKQFANAYFKETIGLNTMITSKYISREYPFLQAMGMVQPWLSLLALVFASALMSCGIAQLCGLKPSKKFMYIAMVFVLLCAAYSIVTPVVLKFTFASSNALPNMVVSLGASAIVQVVFALISVVGLALTKLIRTQSEKDDDVYPEEEYLNA